MNRGTDWSGDIPDRSATRTTGQNDYEVLVAPVVTIDMDIYALESAEDLNSPRLVAGGTGGKFYISHIDGQKWSLSSQSPIDHTIYSIASGSGKFVRFWMAVADGTIYSSSNGGASWTMYHSNHDIHFRAVGYDQGRHNRDFQFYIGGYGEERSRLFERYMWDYETSWARFEEVGSYVQGNYTGISGLSRIVYAVTDRGEFVNFKTATLEENPHTIFFPYGLNTVKVFNDDFYTGEQSVPYVIYVGGANGFMARITDPTRGGDPTRYEIDIVNTGTRENIRSVAINQKSNAVNPEPLVVVAGGDNGTFLYSIDGINFIPLDIGFRGNIRAVAYHAYTDSFFIAGDGGQIFEFTIEFFPS